MQFDDAPDGLHRTLFDRHGRVVARHTHAGKPDAAAALAHAQRDLRDNWEQYRAAVVGDQNGSPDIDSERAAQITENIDRTFDFVHDMIDHPHVLETLPNESMLMFRYALRRGRTMRLTAYLPKHQGARWGARVTGMSPTVVPLEGESTEPQALCDDVDRWPSVAGYDTAEAALDALEAEIGAAEVSGPVIRRAIGA